MELTTAGKRPGTDIKIDVFYDRTDGFSKYINDPMNYKIVLIRSGSFVMETDGEYKVITAPSLMMMNEKADLKVVSQSGVTTDTIYFKPTFIREEFTFEAINSGRYEKFLSAVPGGDRMSADSRMTEAIEGDVSFEKCFADPIYQDALLLLEFIWHQKNIVCYSLTAQEYDAGRRVIQSIRYDLIEQPDNFWILRVRYFLISSLFTATADFYRNFRQDELYKDPLVAEVARYLWENLGEEISLSDILKKFSVNKNTLNDAFNKELSMSCMNYLEQLRVNSAKKKLQFTDDTVSMISNECGYTDTNYFSKVFKKHTGMTASEYRKHMKELI
ncbi:MAG: helix-turn-helix transcriptional regulator [Clostridiales bacterium]|nr:helix-turn-helix transcriptional regulator [Clostridiales bacterium]